MHHRPAPARPRAGSIQTFVATVDIPSAGIRAGEVVTVDRRGSGEVAIHRRADVTVGEVMAIYVSGSITPIADQPPASGDSRPLGVGPRLLHLLPAG